MENQNQTTLNSEKKDLGTIRLTMFAISTTLAGGVFTLSGDFAASGAYPLAVLIGWSICGIGMFFLCMCFFKLSIVKPQLTSGVFSYAREGFGEYIGFCSGWGYWMSAILAQVSFISLFFAALGRFNPAFESGTNVLSIVLGSAIIWFFTILVTRGVSEAVTINMVVVIGKLVPILTLLVAIVFSRAFSLDVFLQNFAGEGTEFTLLQQVKNTTMTMVWIFIGIEGSIVISGRAKTTKIAGKATAISFFCLLALYVMISMLSMGVMSTEELAELGNPPMAGVLQEVVGAWGAVLVNVAVIVSLGGALFSYTILCADAAYAPGSQGCFPKFFTRENKHGAPVTALIVTAAVIQLFLIMVYVNDASFQVCYTLSTSAIMFPYFFSALYYLKVKIKGEGNELDGAGPKGWAWMIAILGTVYGGWMLYASGLTYILVSALLFGPGILLYLYARKENGTKFFPKRTDLVAMIVVLIGFVLSIILIAKGTIDPF